MADTTQTVEVQLRAVDLASGVVKNISKATGGLLKSLDKISSSYGSIVTKLSGIGAVFSLGKAIYSAKDYFEQIKRIRGETGKTANEIAGVQYAMERAGISAGEMESHYKRLVDLGGKQKAGVYEATRLARKLGVDFKKGPVESLVQMSSQLKKGKIHYKELHDYAGNQAHKLEKFLKQGPEALRANIEEARKKMGPVNDQTLAAYSKFKSEVTKIKQAWNRVAITLAARLLPIVNKLMAGFADRIEGWADKAAKFGEILSTHMGLVVGLAKTFGKIMMANYVLMQATGKGLHGHMSGMVASAKAKGGKLAPGGKFGLTQAVLAGGFRGRIAGGLTKMIGRGGAIGRLGKVFASFFKGAMRLGPIAGHLLRLAAVAAIVIAIVKGVKMALKHVKGLQESVSRLMQNIGREINSIGATIKSIFSKDAPIGKALIFIGEMTLKVFSGMLRMLHRVLEFVNQIAGLVAMIIESPSLALDPMKAWKAAGEKVRQERIKAGGGLGEMMKATGVAGRLSLGSGGLSEVQLGKAKKAVAQLEKWSSVVELTGLQELSLKRLKKRIASTETPLDREKNHFDFRGSRFDITQKFAEGFDPDRIAVAFANDLSNLGERKMMANLGPALAR